jgi:peptidoglycan/LPS O-acetylase OafA/YrhL
MERGNRIFFKNLDILRFIAFILVFISHLNIKTSSNFINHFYNKLGAIGVDFFFVISGFLITYLLFYEKILFGKIEIKSFLLRRLLRIWPLYFLVLFFDLAYFLFTSDKAFDLNFLFYPFFLGNIDRIINDLSTTGKFIDLNVLWSIAVEEQFYLIVPFVFFFIIDQRNIFYFFLLFHLAVIVFKIFIIHYANDTSLAYRNLQFNPFSSFDAISIGCLVSYLAHYKKHFLLKIINLKTICLAVFFSVVIILLIYFDYLFNENKYICEVLIIEILIFIFSIIILFNCFKKDNDNTEGSIFINMFNFLGKISYGLYIYHFIVIFFVSKYITENYLVAIFSLVITILVSVFSFNYFEKPLLNLKKKYVKLKTR